MSKKIIRFLLFIIFAIFLTGCSKKTDNLEGKWKEIDANETWHEATIQDGIIEIYWVSDDMNALYWRGTYDAPVDSVNKYEWVSLNRIPEDQFYMMASTAESKNFVYEKGYIIYDASALGVTKKVKLELIEQYEKTKENIITQQPTGKDEFSLELNDNGKIKDNLISINVCSLTENYSFINTFTISNNFKWELHYEQECLPELNIVSKTVDLIGKNNQFYALFINKNNSDDIYLYKVVITKECAYSEETIKESTCNMEGQIKYTCKYNSSHTYNESMEKLDHNLDYDGNCSNIGCTFQKYGPYYTITFNSDGESSHNQIEVQKTRPFQLPTPTKQGYKFLGWYYGDKKIEDGNYPYDYNITLVARWKQIKTSVYNYVYPKDISTNLNLTNFNEDTEGTINELIIKTQYYQFSRWSEYYNEEFASINSISSNFAGAKYSNIAGTNKTLYAILKFTYDNIVYEIIGDNEVAIVGVQTFIDSDGLRKFADTLTIPESVNYDNKSYNVTTIFNFKEISRLYEINLPKTIKVVFGESTSLCYDLKYLNFQKGTHLKAVYGGVKQVDFIILPKADIIIDYLTTSHSLTLYEGKSSDFQYTSVNAHYQKLFIEYEVDIENINIIYNENGIFVIENNEATLVKVFSNDNIYYIPEIIENNGYEYIVTSINDGAFINSYIDNIYIDKTINVSKDAFWQYNYKASLFVKSGVKTSNWSVGWETHLKNVFVDYELNILLKDGIIYYLQDNKVNIISVSQGLDNIYLLDKVTINNKEYNVEPLQEGILGNCTKINELHLYSNAERIISEKGLEYLFLQNSEMQRHEINCLYIEGFDFNYIPSISYTSIYQMVLGEDVRNIHISNLFNYTSTKLIIVKNSNAIVSLENNNDIYYNGNVFCASTAKINILLNNVNNTYVALEKIDKFYVLICEQGIYMLDYYGYEKNLIIPRSMNYNGVEYTVIGIMDKCFEYPVGQWAETIYIPSSIIYVYGRPFVGHSEVYTVINVDHLEKPSGWDVCWNYETYTDPWHYKVNWNVTNN